MVEGERGHVKAHTSVHFQEEWLLKRAEKHGFELLPENFQVWQSDWKIFEKGTEQKRNREAGRGTFLRKFFTRKFVPAQCTKVRGTDVSDTGSTRY